MARNLPRPLPSPSTEDTIRTASPWLTPAVCAALTIVPAGAAAQTFALPQDLPGRDVFLAACAGCHGADGTGVDHALVAFDVLLPDFTDCSFASREPKAQWVAMAHEGGARNGFSTIMPAFGDALSTDQLERVVDYLASLCTDKAWPRGELNLPRPLHTEKAYPEDEAVLTTSGGLESGSSVTAQFTYERRFGARTQLEVVVPWAYRPRADGEGRVAGLGDLVVGLKRALYHDPDAGTILSLGGEIKFPTGDP
ncbi:MAG TPA: c-type cytochrome, partial [Longimicrobiales bacterium]|nr:c-type cytochrome [Longimicrobiales bacterium]